MSDWKPGDVAMVTGPTRYITIGLDDEPTTSVLCRREDDVWIAIGLTERRGFTDREVVSANPTPPKPDEPQGLGAVVEDMAGEKWMRTLEAPAFHPWAPVGKISVDHTWRAYADIAVVRVLSEGLS